MYNLLEALFCICPITFQGATNINDIKIVSTRLTQYDQHKQKNDTKTSRIDVFVSARNIVESIGRTLFPVVFKRKRFCFL